VNWLDPGSSSDRRTSGSIHLHEMSREFASCAHADGMEQWKARIPGFFAIVWFESKRTKEDPLSASGAGGIQLCETIAIRQKGSMYAGCACSLFEKMTKLLRLWQFPLQLSKIASLLNIFCCHANTKEMLRQKTGKSQWGVIIWVQSRETFPSIMIILHFSVHNEMVEYCLWICLATASHVKATFESFVVHF
jgi:hypothetical protein